MKPAIRLNDPQARHLANSLRAVGLGQLAAFGYAALQAGHWGTALGSLCFYAVAEVGALRLLSDVETSS